MVLLGRDRSHWNAEPDFPAFKAGGGAFVICKCTDGTGGFDPSFTACRAGTHAAGLVFGAYHFAEWGDPAAEARWFLSHATPRPGELIALDAEAAIPAGLDVVAWSLAWSKIVHGATGAWPLIYMNSSWLGGHNWTPVETAGDGLWLAKYDGLTTGGPLGVWPVLAMRQFTDHGSMPGDLEAIDEDAFQGDLAALLRYTVPAAAPAPTPTPVPPAPAPVPTPGGPLMALSDQQQADLLAMVTTVFQQVCGPTATPAAPFPKGGGWPTARWGVPAQESLTLVDLLREIDRQLNSALDLSGRPGDPKAADNEFGQLLSLRAEVAALAVKLAATPGVDTAALVAQLVAAFDADLAKRFGSPA